MTITAEVILDSASPKGHRLTTMKLCYPKFRKMLPGEACAPVMESMS